MWPHCRCVCDQARNARWRHGPGASWSAHWWVTSQSAKMQSENFVQTLPKPLGLQQITQKLYNAKSSLKRLLPIQMKKMLSNTRNKTQTKSETEIMTSFHIVKKSSHITLIAEFPIPFPLYSWSLYILSIPPLISTIYTIPFCMWYCPSLLLSINLKKDTRNLLCWMKALLVCF